MKIGKKIVSLFLGAAMIVSSFTGCGPKSGNDNKEVVLKDGQTEIVIAYWNSGTGVEWLEETVKAFEKKYPEYKVTIEASSSRSSVNAALGMEDIDKTDLYMTIRDKSILAESENHVTLNDVLDSTVEGESVSIKEKYNAALLDSLTNEDGSVTSLYYGGGVVSLVYSIDLFKRANITQLPRTTDELAIVCDQLSDNGITPLCHFTNRGYYDQVTNYYQAQYDGFDYYLNNFYACMDENGNTPSEAVLLKKDGRYFALEALGKFVTPEYVLTGSNTKTHTEVQTEFVNDKAAMMFNGSWLRNELATVGGTEKIAMMRMPVLSSIVNNLSTVNNDYLLREVITAVDMVLDGEKQATDFASGDGYLVDGATISAEDWNTVFEARSMVYQNLVEHGMFIPKYSDNIEGAKKFIQFMHSDEGLLIYHETNRIPKAISLSTGESFDTSSFTEFEQSQYHLAETASVLVNSVNAKWHKIFIDGGAKAYADIDYITPLCTNNSSSRKTADQLWDEVVKKIDEQYDKTWLPNIK